MPTPRLELAVPNQSDSHALDVRRELAADAHSPRSRNNMPMDVSHLVGSDQGPRVRGRPVAKAVTWRVISTLVTASLVLVLTRKLALAIAVGGLDLVAQTSLSWLHVLVWDGRRRHGEATRPTVLWFTGLPSSGKSTIARWVADQLRALGLPVEQLDGDTIRRIFPNTGFSRPERDTHVKRVGYLASKLEQHGVFVVASLVSPYEDSRRFVRGLCTTFVEVYVATPLEVCEQRDVKGLYAKARRGEIMNFTGIDDPYEQPSSPELTLDTTKLTVAEAGGRVLHFMRSRGNVD
jgi:adenylylsulfate kinase